jgi:subtilase family serine protease
MQQKKWAALAAALSALALITAPTVANATSGTQSKAQQSETARQIYAEAIHNTAAQKHGTLDYCAALKLACHAQVLTTAPGSKQILTTDLPAGIGAGDLQQAYSLTDAPSADGTITIIDAAAFPPKDLEATLAMYRSTYGLPPCTLKSGCLTVKNRFGKKPLVAETDFEKQAAEQIGVETSLDVDMASAACPGCKIVELQVPAIDGYFGSPTRMHHATKHFGDAVKTAVGMNTSSVSISYGFPADQTEDFGGRIAGALDQKGTTITVSTGDNGYVGTSGTWPQNLRTVIGVGGTSLTKSQDDPDGWAESAWSGAGSSCSPDLEPAVGQPKSVYKNCKNMRADGDISSDAAVQIAVYDGYAPSSGHPLGWFIVGGTSAAAPLVGAIAARSPRMPDISGPNVIYADPSSAFNDVTTGNNGSTCVAQGFGAAVCAAGPGWDGPTGMGTPVGLAPFTS